MRRCVSVFAYAAISLLSLAACKGKEPVEPPVATPSLAFNKERVPIGSPVKLTYKFEVLPDAKFDGDYWVFVHVLDPEGEQLWTDDHLPPTPTSQWKPGQTIGYTRTVFVPNYPYIGEALVRLGLYFPSTGRRLALNAKEVSRKEYLVGRFQLQPLNENIFVIHNDGWHQAETPSENPAAEWEWTKKSAGLSFRNPKKDLMFYLDYDARSDLFTPPQQVTVRVGDQVLSTFPAATKERILKEIPIAAAQLGTGDITQITIEVDKTFVPGGADTRELGIRVFHVFVEPAAGGAKPAGPAS
jgi:hypothetical protein